MSNPTGLSASTVSRPVGTSEPALGGDWMTTWFNEVSMSYSVVPVFGSRSLFVYAAPVRPVAGLTMGGPGVVERTVVLGLEHQETGERVPEVLASVTDDP